MRTEVWPQFITALLVTSFLSGRLIQSFGIGLLLAASNGLVAAAMFGFAFSLFAVRRLRGRA